MTCSAETRLVRRADLMASDLSATETVMMDIDQGLYFGLENVAKDIWDYLASPRTLAELQSYLGPPTRWMTTPWLRNCRPS
jgi:hypothetical protein